MSNPTEFVDVLREGNVKKAEKFIEQYNIDVNASIFPSTHACGFYPAICAASEIGNLKMIKLLVKQGADIDATIGTTGMSALYIACQEGHLSIVIFLVDEGADLDTLTTNETPFSPLHIAVQFGYKDIVKHLVENNANIDIENSESGATPLLLSITTSNEQITKYLIESGANILLCNKKGMSPLMAACSNGLELTVKLLLNAGFCYYFLFMNY